MELYLIYICLYGFPTLLALYLVLQWKDVDINTYLQADFHNLRNQKWWESGSRYQRYVQEEVLNIRKQRLSNIVGKY